MESFCKYSNTFVSHELYEPLTIPVIVNIKVLDCLRTCIHRGNKILWSFNKCINLKFFNKFQYKIRAFCDIFPRNKRVLRRNIEIKAKKKRRKSNRKKDWQKEKELKPWYTSRNSSIYSSNDSSDLYRDGPFPNVDINIIPAYDCTL